MNKPKYIEFEWLIHYKCNYRCPYCFFEGEWEKIEERNKYFPLAKWIAAWKNIAKDYAQRRILITGGEPFIYSSFVELVRELSRYFTIGFDTNLSCSKDELLEFTKNTLATNISMGLSFHPMFSEFGMFLEKALFLKKNGFDNVCIQYVTYPPQLEQMINFRNRFIDSGFYFIPLPFRGRYNGKDYPQAHTEEEKKIIYNSTEGLNSEHKKRVGKHLSQVKSKNKLCGAGQIYARVDSDGTVYRCGRYATHSNDGAMGNIFDESFRMFNEPMTCGQEICPCEFRWIVE